MPSLPALYAIISHFQKLFDVNSLNGIYPRMNEVYTKLGELTNAMRNLHELLELGKGLLPGFHSNYFQRKKMIRERPALYRGYVELLSNENTRYVLY